MPKDRRHASSARRHTAIMPACRSISKGRLSRRSLGEGGPVRRSFSEGGPACRSISEGDLPLFQNEGYNATDKQNVNKNKSYYEP